MRIFLIALFGTIAVLLTGGLLRRDGYTWLAAIVYLSGFAFGLYMMGLLAWGER